MSEKVYSISMSPIATKHALVAGTLHTPIITSSFQHHHHHHQHYYHFFRGFTAFHYHRVNTNFFLVGSNSQYVRLCDLTTTKAAHTLTGHKGAVWNVKWSPSNEFLLATAGADASIKIWDIRRYGGDDRGGEV